MIATIKSVELFRGECREARIKMTGPRLACDAERLHSKRPLHTSLGVFLHVAKTDGGCAEVIKVRLCLLGVAVKIMTSRGCNFVCLSVWFSAFCDQTVPLSLAPFFFLYFFFFKSIDMSHPLRIFHSLIEV